MKDVIGTSRSVSMRRSTLLFSGLAAFVLLTGVMNEFHAGHDGWCGARRGVAARNAVDQGFFATNMGMVLNVGEFSEEEYKPYWHHPAGIHWMVTASFNLFGEGTVQARLVPTFLMGLNLFLFILLNRKWHPKLPIWVPGSLFLSIPMLGFYGPFIAHQPLMLTAALSTLWLRERAEDTGGATALWGSAVVATLAGFTAWAWFLFAFAIGLVSLLRKDAFKARRRNWLIAFSLGTLLGFALVLWHTWIQSGVEWEELDSLFNKRAGGAKVTLVSLLKKMAGPWSALFNPYAILLGLLYLFRSAINIRRGVAGAETSAAFAFLFTGTLWTLIFKQGASVHEYWPWYAAPFFAIAATHGFQSLTDRFEVRPNMAQRVGFAMVFFLVVGTGLFTTYGRHVHPSPSHPEWSESYFHDRIDAWKTMRQETSKDDQLALHRSLLPGGGRAQYRFYANRKHRGLRLKQALSQNPLRKRDHMGGFYLGDLSPADARKVVEHWVKTLDVTVLGQVLMGQHPKGKTPSLTVLRPTQTMPLMLSRWLAPTSPPRQWVESPILARALLLDLGLTERALEGAEPLLEKSINSFETLEEKVAHHNLQLRLFPDTQPETEWLESSLEGWDKEQTRFGREVTVRAKRIEHRWRYGVDVEVLLQVDAAPSQPWRPTLKSVRSYKNRDRTESKSHPFASLGQGDHWHPGQLVLLRRYSALPNRRSLLGVEYRFALWSAGVRKAGPKKRRPYLYPEGQQQRHFVTWPPTNPSGSGFLDWIGLNWVG